MRKDAESEHRHEVPTDLVALSTHGEVGASDAEHARSKIARVASPVGQLVQRITAELRRHPGYSPQDSVEAKAEIDLGGRVLRASAEAADPRAAIDELVDKLGHQVASVSSRHHDHHDHDHPPDLGSEDPGPRIVERRTASAAPITFEQAERELAALDRRFILFADSLSGGDAMLQRSGDGTLVLTCVVKAAAEDVTLPIELDVPTLLQSEAIARIARSGQSLLFFVDAESGRGVVLHQTTPGALEQTSLAE